MLLKNAKVLNSVFKFSKLDLYINNGKIEDIFLPNEYGNLSKYEVIDLTGLTILPGFIDIHTHGCVGYDTMDASYEALNKMSEFMAENGVTSFLPTSMSQGSESLRKAFKNVKDAIDKGVSGASILGLHMEGPYFAPKHKGAQNEKYLKLPSIDELHELQELSGGNIRMLSLAPELEGAIEFIKEAVKQGITVSLGHTGADYDTAVKAIQAGAQHATHLFNGMIGFNHRAPGVVGATLDKAKTVEVISDGIHLHPATIRLVHRVMGPNNTVFVSDSMRATGLKDGSYEFGGQEVHVKDGVARTQAGNIAGSTATLIGCLKKAVEFGIKFEDAVKAMTINPAKVIGVDPYKGSIQAGKDADLVVINDQFEIIYTFVQGKIVVNNA